MTRLADFIRPIPEDRQTREARLRAEEAARPGVFELIGDAVNSEWAGAWALRHLNRSGYEIDPSFTGIFRDDDLFKQMTDGIPDDLWPAFDDAVSLPHAHRIREQMLSVAESRRNLAGAGWTGVGLQVLANITDPAFIASAAVTGGIAGAAKVATAATRLGRLVRGGMIAAAGDVPVQAYISSQDPSQGTREVLYAGAGAFILGGAADAFIGPALAKAAHRLRKDIEFEDTVRYAMGAASSEELRKGGVRAVLDKILTRNGKHYFAEQLSEADKATTIDRVLERTALDPIEDADEIAALRALPPDDALQRLAESHPEAVRFEMFRAPPEPPRPPEPPAGAAGEAAPDDAPKPMPKKAGDLDLSGVTDAESAMSGVRISIAGALGSSKAPEMRLASNMMLQDSLLKKGGGPAVYTAEEFQRHTHRLYQTRFYQVHTDALWNWARAKGRNPRRWATRDAFNREVREAIVRPPGTYTDDVHINRAADNQRRLTSELRDLAERHGVKGFDRFGENPTYLTRIWNIPAIDRYFAELGDDAVHEHFARAIMARTGADDLDAMKKLAKGFLRIVRSKNKYSDIDAIRMLGTDDENLLRELLAETGLDAGEIDNIAAALIKKGDPLNPRAMKRLDIDETYRSPDLKFAIADMMETNAETLFNVYARQITGAAAMSEVFRAFGEKVGAKIDNWTQMKGHIGRAMDRAGIHPDIRDRDLAKLELGFKSIMGMAIDENRQAAKASRMMRLFNRMVYSGQFGVAQIPELGNLAEIVVTGGFRAMLNTMPTLRTMFRRMANGQLEDETWRWLEAVTAPGTDWMTQQVTTRMDDAGDMAFWGGGAMERALQEGARWSNAVSFMAPINAFLQKASAMGAFQSIAHNLLTNRIPKARRLAELGLTEADWRRMAEQMGRHAKKEPGTHRVINPNLDQWTDQQAASKLIIAINKWSRRMVQENSIGGSSAWMNTWWGKIAGEFRRFMFEAYEKQFLHRVQMHDWQAFAGAAASMFMASIAYSLQQYGQSIGREDAADFRRERLSPDAIAKAAFQRSGWSSILPTVFDTAWGLSGGDAVFNYRNSGLGTGFGGFAGVIASNPTTAYGDSLARAIRGVGRTIRGDEFSEKDAKAWTDLLPFSRVTGVRNVLDAITTRFPEEQ